MFRIEHRDMSPAERRIVESEAEAARRERSGGSSRPVAVGLLILGSFFVGLVFFGLPFSTIVDPRDRDLAIFGPALASMLVGGTWSTIYFLLSNCSLWYASSFLSRAISLFCRVMR